MLEKIRSFLSEQLGVEPDAIDEDTDIIADLNADSLDVVELLAVLEEEYDILIVTDDNEEELAKLSTVGSIIEYIEANQ